MSAQHAQYDAIVVGGGHNGLVAANLLADRGWDVVVLEAAEHPGGAVWSDEALAPGFVTDRYSAFYPLGAASPVLDALDLHEHGLRWSHAPAVLAHVLPDDRCAVLYRDVHRTAESVESFARGDGAAWEQVYTDFQKVREPLLQSIFGGFPPVRPALRLLRTLGIGDGLRFARFAVQSVRRYADEHFGGEGAAVLLAGNALHTDLPPESAGSAIYGWLLTMLGQHYGYPVPVGGSRGLTDALAARLRSRGVTIQCGTAVERVLVRDGTATGVRLADGTQLSARAVLADASAPSLYCDLVGAQHLPSKLVDDLGSFQWDAHTLKVNWALRTPIPWTASGARGAGTVHLGVDLNGLTRYAGDLATRTIPEHPLLLVGQMTTSDPTRSPAGTESAWCYTHLPDHTPLGSPVIEQHVERIEQILERHAPGFGISVIARDIQTPGDLELADANLFGGAVNGGTASIHQQLVFRPTPGLGRADTVIDRLYLASASAHPGGGVHGGPGANAARSALRRESRAGGAYRRAVDAAFARIYR